MLQRLWSMDSSLWPADERQEQCLKANLGWLDLPQQMGPHMARVATWLPQHSARGFETCFLSLGETPT